MIPSVDVSIFTGESSYNAIDFLPFYIAYIERILQELNLDGIVSVVFNIVFSSPVNNRRRRLQASACESATQVVTIEMVLNITTNELPPDFEASIAAFTEAASDPVGLASVFDEKNAADGLNTEFQNSFSGADSPNCFATDSPATSSPTTTAPASAIPSNMPSSLEAPSQFPSNVPSQSPSSESPIDVSSSAPSMSVFPSSVPSHLPSSPPVETTVAPSATTFPSTTPSSLPSTAPSGQPSVV